jgi:pilus assembly protein Flp/PilA
MAIGLPNWLYVGSAQPERNKRPSKERHRMRNAILKLLVKTQWLEEEDGQDLVEYALVLALVSFAATAGMNTIAAALNTAFSNVAATLNAYIT